MDMQGMESSRLNISQLHAWNNRWVGQACDDEHDFSGFVIADTVCEMGW